MTNYVVSSYDDFVLFLDNFELTIESLAQKKPFLMVALGDFNAKSSNWFNKDITSDEGRKTGSNFTKWFPSRN